jgi:hypothetical protein
MKWRLGNALPVLGFLVLASCGRDATPASPSPTRSFLQGTWNGTITIERDGQTSAGSVSWTFDVVDGTDLRTFRVTIRSQHAWLPITTTVTSAIDRATSPPRASARRATTRRRGDAPAAS